MLELKRFEGGFMPTNCYLLIDGKSVVLFDFVPEVIDYINKEGLTLEKIFLTHVHYDHIEGLYDLIKDQEELEFLLTEEQKANINNPMSTLVQFRADLVAGRGYGDIDTARAKIVDENEEIVWRGHNIKLLKTPGHSVESVVFIIDEAESIISGDTIFRMSVGRSDFPGGNHETLINSVNRVLESVEGDYKIYPGHGPATTVNSEKTMNPFLN